MPGRNLAVLTEAAVRVHILRAKGVDPGGRLPGAPRATSCRSSDAREATDDRRAPRTDPDHRQRHVRLRQVGRAAHARGPRLLLRRQPAGGAAARVRAARRRATTARRTSSRSASTCATGARPVAHPRVAVGGRRARARPTAGVLRHPRRRAAASATPTRAAAIRCQPPRAWRSPMRSRWSARRCKPLRAIADVVHRHQRSSTCTSCAGVVITEFGLSDAAALSLLFESFAYRRGVPADADFVFDARCLPNPHWDARLRPLSGRDAAVREYLEAQPDVRAVRRRRSQRFLDTWLPRLRIGHAQLRHRRLRLHRRPAPFGVPGRAPRAALPRPGLGGGCGAPSGAGLSASWPPFRAAALPPATLHAMTVGILLITHEGIGSALLAVATRLLRQLPLQTEAFEVPFDADPDALLPPASAALRRVDGGQGVLVLTDLYGATPSNLAAQARAHRHAGAPRVRAEPADAAAGDELRRARPRRTARRRRRRRAQRRDP